VKKGDQKLLLVNPVTRSQLDAVMVYLYYLDEFSLLPELYEVFGKEKLMDFLDIFSGCEFRVPSRNILERAARDVTIYSRVKLHEGKDTESEVVADLASHFSLSEAGIRKIYKAVKEYFEETLRLKVDVVR